MPSSKDYGKTWRDANKEKIKTYNKQYHQKNKVKIQKKHKEWCNKNQGHLKKYQQKYNIDYYKENSASCRERHFLNLYGVTLEQRNQMLLAQNCKCAICGSGFKNSRDAHIDHNHSTGKIRQVLCGRCNLGIGRFNEDVTILMSAIKYIEKWTNEKD